MPRLEELQARTRAARAALEAIPPLLGRFRQSVLAAAFRGDLTADWRARNPDVEPASELLKRIRAERRLRWEEAEYGVPLEGTLPSAIQTPCVEADADLLPLFGHPDLAGIMAGFSLKADWGAPIPTPNLDPEMKASLQDLTDRVNVLLRAQAFTLAAVAELLQVARAGRETR